LFIKTNQQIVIAKRTIPDKYKFIVDISQKRFIFYVLKVERDGKKTKALCCAFLTSKRNFNKKAKRETKPVARKVQVMLTR
jgi:hypothetical protein